MNPADVADWLSCHPEFFNDHPELLTELRIRVPRDGSAIPLIERQVLALKDAPASQPEPLACPASARLH